jgi:hypothetical protein
MTFVTTVLVICYVIITIYNQRAAEAPSGPASWGDCGRVKTSTTFERRINVLEKNKPIIYRILEEKRSRRWIVLATAVATLLLGAMSALAATQPGPTNVSGRETFPGIDCGTKDGQPFTCGTSFRGWIGGNGPVSENDGGWVPFPGQGGSVVVRINYLGTARVPGGSVTIKEGTWRIYFGKSYYHGKVLGGTVQWPESGSEVAGFSCGTDVAVVQASLSDDASSFVGCLDDIPKPIIPKIWGTFSP